MRKPLVALVVLSMFLIPVMAPPAQADMLGKAEATIVNGLFGWLECPKAVADEVPKAASRWYVGILVTAPTMCAANVGYRYIGVAGDALTLPWGDNLVRPGVFAKSPPLRLP